MNFVDFFAGIGGIRLGLEQAGHKFVGFCEFDKYARTAYKAMYDTEGEWENHDVRTVKPYDVPDADLWCFGFPCQDISVAGKQKGLQEGERSGLFYEIMRLLAGRRKEDRPRWLLIENVKNLLSIGNGFDFARLLCEVGGVRVFSPMGYSQQRAARDYKGISRHDGNAVVCMSIRGQKLQKQIDVAPTIDTGFRDNLTRKQTCCAVLTPDRGEKRQNGRRIKEPGEPSFTLTAQDRHGVALLDENIRIRRLTPRECWRLQGFPDEYFDKAKAAGISDTQLYKQAGNSVTVNVARAIGEKLKEVEHE